MVKTLTAGCPLPLFALASAQSRRPPYRPSTSAPLSTPSTPSRTARTRHSQHRRLARKALSCTWYAGITPEDHNNYVVLSTSGDNGKPEEVVLVADPDADGPRRTFDPELWLSPDGKVRWIWG